jgi:hypothetical protein
MGERLVTLAGRKITLGITNVQRKLRVVTNLGAGPSLRAFSTYGRSPSSSLVRYEGRCESLRRHICSPVSRCYENRTYSELEDVCG